MARLFRAAVAAGAVLAGAAAAGSAAASSSASSGSADSGKAHRVASAGPSLIAGVTLDLDRPAEVLVRFTSSAVAETTEGCPCAVAAFLRMDGGALQPVGRVSLGARAATRQAEPVRDRQGLDGSFVFPAEAGPHTFEFLAQQVAGRDADLRIHRPDLQATALPR